jgi:hypothetical protein
MNFFDLLRDYYLLQKVSASWSYFSANSLIGKAGKPFSIARYLAWVRTENLESSPL